MSRAKPLMATALAAGSLLMTAGIAAAQSAPAPGQAAGLRYLSWNGRQGPSPTAVVQPPASQPEARRADLRRPNRVIPHGGFAHAGPAERPGLTPAPGVTPGRLTPADAWAPATVSVSRPEPAPPVITPAPVQGEPPRELAPPGYPDYLPSRGRQPVPSSILPQPVAAQPVYNDAPPPPPEAPPAPNEAPQPAPEAAPSAPVDPMAPRRDAPIFRLQRPSAATAAPAPAPTQPESAPASQKRAEAAPPRTLLVAANTNDRPDRDQGARYYSVHRQNGRTPDPLALPDPTYIDALAVTMAETPASQDLAAPDPGPTLIRDGKGRTRVAPAASDGDHQ